MELSGSICALVTPFTAQGDGDLDALRRLVERHVEAGTQALVIAGSTGESFALEDSELLTLWRVAVDTARARLPILAGTGAASTARSLRLTRLAAEAGVDAALVVTPSYCRPTQAGLLEHYTLIADQGGLPLVLYNVPTRTGVDLRPETVARLAEHPRIIGIKEALADPARMDALIALRSARFRVYSGDDPSALDALRRGMDGVVSVAANVVPEVYARFCRAALAGDWSCAEALDRALQPLYRALALESNPIPVKWLLAQRGWIDGRLRLPLLPLAAEHHAAARAALAQALALVSA